MRFDCLKTCGFVVFVAALVGSSVHAAPAAEPYVINVVVSLTGQGAFLGKQEQQSIELIEAMVNKTGGIGGRPVKFQVFDDQTNPQVDVQLFNDFVAKKAAIVLGPSFTAPCLAAAPLIAQHGPVMYCFSPIVHPTRGSFMFVVSASVLDDINVLIRNFRLRGKTRLGLITSNDATGQEVERAVAIALARSENKNVKLVESARFGLTDISVAAQMSRLKAAGSDAIIAWTTGSPFGTLLHGISDAGIDVPIGASPGDMISAQMVQYGQLLPNQLLFPGQSALSRGANPGPVRDAQNVYFKAFGSSAQRPDFGNLIVWDAAMLTIDTLRKIGPNATAEQVRDRLDNVHGWAGTQGIYDFSDTEQRGVGEGSLVIIGWDKAKKEWLILSRPNGYLLK